MSFARETDGHLLSGGLAVPMSLHDDANIISRRIETSEGLPVSITTAD